MKKRSYPDANCFILFDFHTVNQCRLSFPLFNHHPPFVTRSMSKTPKTAMFEGKTGQKFFFGAATCRKITRDSLDSGTPCRPIPIRTEKRHVLLKTAAGPPTLTPLKRSKFAFAGASEAGQVAQRPAGVSRHARAVQQPSQKCTFRPLESSFWQSTVGQSLEACDSGQMRSIPTVSEANEVRVDRAGAGECSGDVHRAKTRRSWRL